MFLPFVIVVYESLSCPQCENMDLKIIQSLFERVQICRRCWKTKECAGAGGTAQNQQWTHEQLSQNIKTVMDHPGNNNNNNNNAFYLMAPFKTPKVTSQASKDKNKNTNHYTSLCLWFPYASKNPPLCPYQRKIKSHA